MRSAEVRTMRPCQIDRSGPVWVYRPPEHKCEHHGHDRAVALGPKCQALLRRWLERAGPDDFLFPPARARGGPGCYDRHGYAQAVRRAAEAAGVEGFHAYLCRHAARDRIAAALGSDAARAVLGHASLRTTELYGSRLDLDAAVRAARRVG